MSRNQKGINGHMPSPPDDEIRPYLELYHSINRSDVEIVELLKSHYDTTIYNMSIKTVKRRRAKWGLLSTRQQNLSAEDIQPIVAEIRERFPSRGQESIRKTLMLEYKMKVSRKVIAQHLLDVEPKEVEKRKGKCFKRKCYYAAGVNDVWPQDQHDKWGRYGLWLHCSLDAYTSWINWLMVWWTNSNPRLITKYYLDCCRKIGGCPLTTQADPGTENNGVANVQTLIRHTLDPSLKDTRQHRIMCKHNNIKSESNWSIFRRDFAPGFETIFDYGVNHGLYDINVVLEKYVFRWLAIPWIQAEIDNWVFQRNFTAPRRDKNKILPQGVPAIIRANPEKHGTHDYKIGVPYALFDEMEAKYAPPNHPVFELTPPDFDSLANLYYNEMGQPLVTSKSFWVVYQGLLHRFKDDKTENPLQFAEFSGLLSEHDEATQKINEEDLPLLPGLKALRAGGAVVGQGADSDKESICVDMTEDENDDDKLGTTMDSEEEVQSSLLLPGGVAEPPTFMASMTPSIGSTSLSEQSAAHIHN